MYCALGLYPRDLHSARPRERRQVGGKKGYLRAAHQAVTSVHAEAHAAPNDNYIQQQLCTLCGSYRVSAAVDWICGNCDWNCDEARTQNYPLHCAVYAADSMVRNMEATPSFPVPDTGQCKSPGIRHPGHPR